MDGEGSVLEGYDVVAGLDGCDALADGLDDAGALVAEHDWECTLRVFAGECVCIYALSVLGNDVPLTLERTGVADSGIVDFYPDFVGLWRGDFDVFDGEIFACLPSHGGLYIVSLLSLQAVGSGDCSPCT